MLALFLIITSLTFLLFKKITINPTIKNSIFGGVFSNVIPVIIRTGGAIRGIKLAVFNLNMQTFIATTAIIDLEIDFSRSIVYYTNAYVHGHDLYLIPILLVVSIIGTYLGKKYCSIFLKKNLNQLY